MTTTTTLQRPRALRMLLALGAAGALLLTGCGDDAGSADPAGGQLPGSQQLAGTTPSEAPSTVPTPDAAEPDGPSTDSPATVAPAAAVDLADFPLAAGWPDEPMMDFEGGGLELPVEEFFASFAEETCGATAPEASTTDSVRGQFSDVEAYLSRELLVFEDADAAVDYVAELDDFYAGDECTGQVLEGGETTVLRRVDTGAGGESFVLVRGTEFDGEPQTGIAALHVVRVGRSVLLDTTAGEGLADGDLAARRLADSMTDRAGDVVAAQCAFTEAGC